MTDHGITHPAGSWVIPMDQEFSDFARTLFAIQDYPDLREFREGPPIPMTFPGGRFPISSASGWSRLNGAPLLRISGPQ